MSIVSVYCKSLLRLFIVGVYCKYLLCFIVFSVQNVARSIVLLRFRLQMLLFECVLLCFCSPMCKKHYKTNQKSCFLHINSPNPLFYRCKCLAMFISLLIVFKPFILRRFEKQLSRSAAGWPGFCFTLCVCFCIFPSLNQNENPIRSETSVREKWSLRSHVNSRCFFSR